MTQTLLRPIMLPVHRDLPSGTVTFLFTDVEGSTRLLHELGAAGYAEALAEHRRILRDAFGAHSGVEVDMQGDAFFVAFPTAPGAVAAAAQALEGLSLGPIRVRMGIHTGTPHMAEEGYVGADVHRAARIAACGHGGQVLVSAATAYLLGTDGLRDLGEHRLKDLSAPERIYQLGDEDFPPLQSLHQTNLPIPSTPFLGREQELQEVLSLLSQANVRLLTLTGPGGTGKTRLAAQAAGLSSTDYPDGVWWVPLAPLRDPQLVLETAAQALGAKNGLAELIGQRSLLVLFDNFEQVMDAAADVAGLLASCPKLDLLVTSREPLHVTGEQEYPVPPFVHEEGVGFFLARAQAVKPDFEADEAVSEICRRLDSLPLALELAAARVKALSSGQILERLEQRLPLLTGGARDLPERQRTLRAAIEWSYELLSPEEQRLFARLSVFRGGCTLEAAEEVSGADLDTLQSLVDKSLLRHSDERYWMLETIREYAFARLEQADEAAELRSRHARLFCALGERAKPELRGETLGGWLVRLAAEYPNLRAALEWGLEAGGDIVPRLAGSVWRFWHIRGYFREGRFWTFSALAQLGSEPSALRAELLSTASAFDLRAGELDSALRLARESLAVAEAVGAVQRMAVAWNDIGNVQVELDDREAGREAFEHALELHRDVGDERGILADLGNLGNIAMANEDYAEASRLFRECLQRAERVADDSDTAWAASNLGLVLVETRQLAAAKEPLRRSLRLMRQLGWSEGSVYSLIALAAACANEAPVRSATLAGAAEALRHELGLSLQVVEKRLSEHTVATLRSRMGTDAFQSAWAEGQTMSLDDAVEYALRSND